MINYNHTVVVFLLLALGIFKLGSCTENQSQTNNVTVKWIQTEREALVSFMTGVNDIPGKLSSWVGEDCCKWKGVECDKSGHVTKLNLSNPAGIRRHYEYDESDNDYERSASETCVPCNRYRPQKRCFYCMRSSLHGKITSSLNI